MEHGNFSYGYGFMAPMAARVAAAAGVTVDEDRNGATPLRLGEGGGSDLTYGFSHQGLQGSNVENESIPQGEVLFYLKLVRRMVISFT